MKVLITGACGFVGSALAHALADTIPQLQLIGIDNLIRPGSETNAATLKNLGLQLHHGDLRCASDLESLPPVDWVIDAAANPSVLAGVDGRTSSRQLVEHNLGGTINLLEFCRSHRAGFILLSTSRVYSIPPLAALPVETHERAFRLKVVAGVADPGLMAGAFSTGVGDPGYKVPTSGVDDPGYKLPAGVSAAGIDETFSTAAPVSLYGATKLASEALALEYGASFGFPVFINRCGVLAGAGQFGRPDQGIFSFWINSHLRRRPLRYIGFDGKGHQVRDCLHPRDLAPLIARQFDAPKIADEDRLVNVSGGAVSSRSLRQLTEWCDARFGAHPIGTDATPRPFDLPWVVLDHARATRVWGWQPLTPVDAILGEIAEHAEANPEWLELSAPR